MVKMRRDTQNKKQTEKNDKAQDDHYRAIKQVRLTNRVKQSPALANNALELKRQRKNSLQRGRDNMKYLENDYLNKKAMMEFNVAKRPLLVE